MRTFKIELRVDFEDDSRYEIMLASVRDAARQLVTTAEMLRDRREPKITVDEGDVFRRDKDISILEDVDNDLENIL